MKIQFMLIILFQIGIICAGTIKGKIYNSKDQQPLVGANVVVLNSSYGASSDVLGMYIIEGIPAGIYTVQVSYIGYEDYIFSPLIFDNGELIIKDFKMVTSVIKGNLITVSEKLKQGSDASLLDDRKKETVFNDGISARDISKAGDSNAADAIRRISGVSVSDGKFAVVRGLDDRYTNTVLNNSSLPTTEADKKVVPLDIFPTALLSEIVAYKTYSPDMPGTFAGGNINIKTKAYPDTKILSIKLSTTQKSSLIGKSSYLNSPFGMEFFGYGGDKSLPSIIPKDQPISSSSDKQIIGQYGTFGKKLGDNFSINREKHGLPLSIGINYGNHYNVSDWLEYGFFSNFVFSNSYSNQEYKSSQFNKDAISYKPYTDRSNTKSKYSTNLGYNISLGINLLNAYKLKYQFLHSHSTSDNTIVSIGYTPNIEGLFIMQSFNEKEINSHTFSGNYIFSSLNNSIIDWSLTLGKSDLNEPDTRKHNYDIIEQKDENDDIYYNYEINNQGQKFAYRDFTSGVDENNTFSLNLKTTLKNFDFKIGQHNQESNRTFSKRQFHIASSSDEWQPDVIIDEEFSNINELFNSENYCYYDDYNNELVHGLVLFDETANNATNAYDAFEKIMGNYFIANSKIDFKDMQLLFSAGFRQEIYSFYLKAYDSVTGATAVGYSKNEEGLSNKIIINDNNVDYLPAFNVSFSIKNSHKFRVSYSETLNRPQFRERAPLAYQEFYQGNVSIGYPYLKTANINNFDLRYEWYISGNEIFSLSYFHKDFSNPIEIGIISTPDLNYKTYQNASSATTNGIEFEIRKSIPHFFTSLGKLNLVSNLTLSQSRVKANDVVVFLSGTEYANASSDIDRQMQGHSKILFNSILNYKFNLGYSISLSYNSFSKRIQAVGAGIGNIYEFPFRSLNFKASKSFGLLNLSIKIKNLLNSIHEYGLLEESSDSRYLTYSYSPGYAFSIGINYNIK